MFTRRSQLIRRLLLSRLLITLAPGVVPLSPNFLETLMDIIRSLEQKPNKYSSGLDISLVHKKLLQYVAVVEYDGKSNRSDRGSKITEECVIQLGMDTNASSNGVMG